MCHVGNIYGPDLPWPIGRASSRRVSRDEDSGGGGGRWGNRCVYDADKMECEKRGEGQLDLGEFAYVATKMALPEMKSCGWEVLKEREEFWGAKKHIHGEKGVVDLRDDYYSRD
ncbi:hypothetical protein BGZ61DRAFT_540408 [Ilyonectria robusta]|uniref:uncharacterized protein n=1 Tax=Ilyonectria robusta TaxID=1079257 RepID=UPI001E8D9F27|nr:uncharacterized protein BGZ61DRAFT_540408 [Ilyonectria robusta]KAH8658893.1 hypothetical protein BGZ61DRAFT_540408 [Ilyonectria robusta]